jgi:hypothetical protein
MEDTSVPESLPAREGTQPGGSSGSTGPSPSEVKGTRDPHYPDSDHDQRTLLMMLLQIQQHAPGWMHELDLHSNVLQVLLALRKSGLASTFERFTTWLSYSPVAAALEWIIRLHRSSFLTLRVDKKDILPDVDTGLLVATAARVIHRIFWLKVDSLTAGYGSKRSPSYSEDASTTDQGQDVVSQIAEKGDCMKELKEDLKASGQNLGDYPITFAWPSFRCEGCQGSSCTELYTDPSQPPKLTKRFCVNCLHDASRIDGPSRKPMAIYERAHQQQLEAIRVEEIEADQSYAFAMVRALSEHTTPKTVRLPAASLAGEITLSEIPLDAGLRKLLGYISEAWVVTQDRRPSLGARRTPVEFHRTPPVEREGRGSRREEDEPP